MEQDTGEGFSPMRTALDCREISEKVNKLGVQEIEILE